MVNIDKKLSIVQFYICKTYIHIIQSSAIGTVTELTRINI